MRSYRILFFLLFIAVIASTNVQAEKIYITEKKVNIRTGPDTTYDILGTARQDDYFERIENLNSWSQIILPDGKTGWISDQFISLKKPNALPDKIYVIAKAVNIRVGPGINYNKIAEVKENDELEPIKILNGWIRVILPDGDTGWISEKYISLNEKNKIVEKVYVTGQTVNIRVGPGINYNKILEVKEDDELERIKSQNGWAQIRLQSGQTGWISEKFISKYNDGFVYSDSVLQFRSFKWGSTKSQVLRQLKEEGYSFTLDNNEIIAFLKELFGHECQVCFHFTPNSRQLFMIELLWPQIDISERAKRILVYKYGVPNQKDEKTGDLIWVDGDISLKLDTDLKDTKIYYTHSKLSQIL
ncbi:MAG: SH3 domain-containing protein [bacterium]